MKFYKFIILLALFMLLSPSVILAGEALEPSEARWNILKKVGGGALGIFLGAVGHYHVGHRGAALLFNADIEWKGFTKWETREGGGKLRAVGFGGFAEQVIGSELVLGIDAIPKDNSITLGYLAWNILEPLGYTIYHFGFDNSYGDLASIDKSGLNPEWVAAYICTQALLTGWRLYKRKDIPVYFRATWKEFVIGFRINFD